MKGEGRYELIDGFKRLRACRRLNKESLRAKMIEVNGRGCKAAIIQLNQSGRSINEIEEALVLQSLHREDGLTQIEIAALLGRDKSWVSRRIALIEKLSEEVQEDIRLGLISMITGRELSKLPRGNQRGSGGDDLKASLQHSGGSEVDRASALLARDGSIRRFWPVPGRWWSQDSQGPGGLGPNSSRFERSAKAYRRGLESAAPKQKEIFHL